MFVEQLSLTNYRSYPAAELTLAEGVNVFLGANGQGKTNLVEAIEYLSRLASHRVSSDAPLVRMGADQAIVRGRVRAGREDARALLLDLEINPGRSNRARINKNALPRTRDLLGVLRTVVFSPEDLAIVKGDPGDRRSFIDSVVITRWPRMAGVKADYDRVVKQRNSLLKAMSGKHQQRADPEAEATLEVWNENLAHLGSELLLARLDTLDELMPLCRQAYATIAPQNNALEADYRTSVDTAPAEDGGVVDRAVLAQRMKQAMLDRRSEEIARGVSLIGPHRDEIVLSIGAMPAKGYASHGECWSLALSLKLAAFGLLQADGIEPVLVLDDVFAELDAIRRVRLAESILSAEQVLITAAVGTDVPELLVGRRFQVGGGRVWPEEGAADEEADARDTGAPENSEAPDTDATGTDGPDSAADGPDSAAGEPDEPERGAAS